MYKEANTFNLGDTNTNEGQDSILKILKRNKHTNKQSVIFIGNLRDDFIDIHETAYGSHHGSIIILNQFYAFTQRCHLMSIKKWECYIISLLFFFFGVLYWILEAADKRDTRNNAQTSVPDLHGVIEYIKTTGSYILASGWYIVLLIMALSIQLIFNKLINVFGLIYILPLFSSLLKYWIDRRH